MNLFESEKVSSVKGESLHKEGHTVECFRLQKTIILSHKRGGIVGGLCV